MTDQQHQPQRRFYRFWNRNWQWSVIVNIILMAAIGVLLLIVLAGCSTNTRTEGSRVLERVETPTHDGGKIVRETERTEQTSETVTKADLSAAVAAIQAAVAGARGDIPGAVAALIPKPSIPTAADLAAAVRVPEAPKILGMETPDLIAAAAAIWASERGMAAWHKRRRLRAETSKPERKG
jgi:hypothetical protein